MPPCRVLLVDDDPAIRTSLDEILRKEGFEVTVCASVTESLTEINSKTFDALISDLNIGEPSDGFTVVSAMRRTQPQAITLIMTGFPAFDSALEAIRQQVDAYLLKPTDVRELVGLLRRGLTEHRGKHVPLPRRRLYEVVRDSIDDVIQQWTAAMRKMNRAPWSNLKEDQLIDGFRVLLDELCYRVEMPDATVREESLNSAREHGSLRARQKYSVLDLMVETRNLRLVLLNVVHEHLIELNLSNVFTDLFTMSDTLDEMAMTAVAAFLAHQAKS